MKVKVCYVDLVKDKLTIALAAQVDAGKTTLIEQVLYQSGSLAHPGRVDQKNSFLDYDPLERERGITIEAKSVSCTWNQRTYQLLDTPGHADLAGELEKVLPVCDLLIILIDGMRGIQAHTKTIWMLAAHYQIPVLFFLNKADQMEPEALAQRQLELQQAFGGHIYNLADESQIEQIALMDDGLLEEFVENEGLSHATLNTLIAQRKLFALFQGSALKGEGTQELLDFLADFPIPAYPEAFDARVFSLFEGKRAEKLMAIKLTGGSIRLKEKIQEQSIHAIYQMQGEKLISLMEARAGDIVAINALEGAHAGMGLGKEKEVDALMLSSFLQYEVHAENKSSQQLYPALLEIARKDPTLRVEKSGEHLYLSLSGEIQQQILAQRLEKKLETKIYFGERKIAYLESIASEAYGIGHFEPLRHYAEVHVLLRPGKPACGLKVYNDLKPGSISLGFEHMILQLLESIDHKGLLTGSPLTDLEIHLVAAKASKAHSSQADFYQACLRAVRNALAQSEMILLEPKIRFELALPAEFLSRALYDLDRLEAEYQIDNKDEHIVIKGSGPLRTLSGYAKDVLVYTSAKGSFTFFSQGYMKAKEPQKIVQEIGYDWLLDHENPAGSIFFENGAGFGVDWKDVFDYAHIPLYIQNEQTSTPAGPLHLSKQAVETAFNQAGGKNKKQERKSRKPRRKELGLEPVKTAIKPVKKTCLLVDGYNMIFAWKELKELARVDLSAARDELVFQITNYAGYKDMEAKIIFDAYKGRDTIARSTQHGSIEVVYTHHNQSADAYMESLAKKLQGRYTLLVATNDALIQNSILSHGALRISAAELERRVKSTTQKALKEYLS